MDRRVVRVVELIRERGRARLRIAELARDVGLGPSRLEHLFREHARISIRDFIRNHRLTAAAELLASTDERISTICFHVGFQDVANFNHAFKKRFGISPRVYRQRSGNGETADFTKS